jgi:hypothetical protein
METPNTRFRRKREDDTPGSSRPGGSQEDDRVVWVHDQRLKRAVLLATEHGRSYHLRIASLSSQFELVGSTYADASL